ncbi:MAG: hypothetical protein U9R47_08765, partial [Actinomycetota bacterium]|nr:hypothetical protein [Actinomycetota bacterium]
HRSGEGTIDVSSKIELTHLRVALGEQEADISLDDAELLKVIFGGGSYTDAEKETLAEVIRQINEQLGRPLTRADQIMFDQMEREWIENDQLADQARANDHENFGIAFAKVFESSMLDRLSKNEELVVRILDSEDIRTKLESIYVGRVYDTLRSLA